MESNKNHIHLFGNPEENFYVLGKKDKNSYEEVYKQTSMLCAKNNYLAQLIKSTTDFSRKFIYQKPNNHYLELKAYAEGLERPVADVLFTFLLPELVASFNKFTPNLLSLIPGCSSLFIYDKKNDGVIHNRILDYALSGSFEKYERSISYEFPNRYKVFSFSTSGIPLPSFSGMNEKGLTLALHYKHGKNFNFEGESIFMLAADILFQCADIREALKFIKDKKSISYWGLYLSDSNGEILSIDINGHEIYQEKYDIRDHEYLYFNNRPLIKKNEHLEIQPYGNLDQCLMRYRNTQDRFKNFNIDDSKNISMDTLKILTKDNKHKAQSAKHWTLGPINTSSIQAISFDAKNQSAIYQLGMAPKFFSKNQRHFSHIFSTIQIKENNEDIKENSYQKGMRLMASFQTSFDMGNISKAYHEIQMSIQYLSEYPEGYICKFFFIVIEYIYESDKRDLSYLFDELLLLQDKLPPYLEDHRKLFLMRLGKLIGHHSLNKKNEIKNKQLKNIYDHEFKLNNLAIKGLKKLIFPRIDVLDIIYAY